MGRFDAAFAGRLASHHYRIRTVLALALACPLAVGLLIIPSSAQGSPVVGPRHSAALQPHHAPATDVPWSTVKWAGYSVELPRTFARRSPTNCETDSGSFVIVGTYTALRGCTGLDARNGVTVLLGQGGPAYPPVPDVFGGDISVHGVQVQELIGTDAVPGRVATPTSSFLLALLPGMGIWAYMAAPGSVPANALKEPFDILATLRRSAGSPPAVPAPVSISSFVGSWSAHDASLKITSASNGELSTRGGCLCVDYDTLAFSLLSDHLDAVVTKVRAIGAGGHPMPDPHPDEIVGQRLFFEFVEPHLLMQVTVPNEPRDWSVSFGNPPYWCGAGLAARFGFACGL